jgi:HK97 family phage prohead protease
MSICFEYMKEIEGICPGAEGKAFAANGKLELHRVKKSERLFSGIIASACADIVGDVVLPAGCDLSYFPTKVKAVYWNHDYNDIPIGTCRWIKLNRKGQLEALTYITKTPFGDDLLTAIEEGAVEGLSIGFTINSQRGPTGAEQGMWKGVKNVVESCKLLEYSITPMPCNPEAVFQLERKGAIRGESSRRMTASPPPAVVPKSIILPREITLDDVPANPRPRIITI